MRAVLRTPLCAALASSLLCGSASLAGPPSPSKSAPAPAVRDAADDWFDKGIAAYEAHKLNDAEAAFLEAWKLKKTQDIAANLGTIELELHEPRRAAEHLAYAVRHGAPTDSDAARRAARDRFDQARKLVGAIKVVVSVPGASVYANGELVGTAPIEDELFVDAGSTTLEAKLAGYQDARAVVQADAGSAQDVTLTLAPPRRSAVPAVVVGSIGGAALATAVGLFVAAGSKASTVQDEYTSILKAGHSCAARAANFDARCDGLHSTASTGDAMHNAAVGLMAVAGATAVGAVVYMVWPQTTPVAPRVGAVRITPAVSPTDAGLLFSGTF